MQFHSSPKVFKNYKSAYPKGTIANAKKFLKDMGLNLEYEQKKLKKNNCELYFGNLWYNSSIISSGKGTTNELSCASTYCEILERLLNGISKLSPFLTEKQKEIFKKQKEKIDKKIDIKEFLQNFPEVDLNKLKKHNIFKNWKNAHSLCEEKNISVPDLFISNISRSNGCAAGNTLEEAISQAFCEICERYSTIEHIINKKSAPTVKKQTIKNKKIQNFIALFESLNFKIEIKDLSFGNRVPVMGIIFTNRNLVNEEANLRKQVYYKTLAVGSHFDLEEAITRCFIEQIQFYNDFKDFQNPGCLNPDFHTTRGKAPTINVLKQYFTKEETKKIIQTFNQTKRYIPLVMKWRSFTDFDFLKGENISFGDLQSKETKDFLEEIELIKNISLKNNWRTLILDYSVDKCPIKVVRVVIPSISDLLRYKYKRINDIDKLTVNILQSEEENITKKNNMNNKIFHFLELALVENLLPYPPYRLLNVSPIRIMENLFKMSLILKKTRKYNILKNILTEIAIYRKY